MGPPETDAALTDFDSLISARRRSADQDAALDRGRGMAFESRRFVSGPGK
jgi:hypothetical protein